MIYKKLYTITEAAKILNCTVATLRKAVHEGRIYAFQVTEGGNFKIPAEEIDKFFKVESKSAGPL